MCYFLQWVRIHVTDHLMIDFHSFQFSLLCGVSRSKSSSIPLVALILNKYIYSAPSLYKETLMFRRGLIFWTKKLD